MQWKIHLFIHPQYFGEKNQVLGIKNALEQHGGLNLISKEWDNSQEQNINSIIHELTADPISQQIIVTSGEQGLQLLQKMGPYLNKNLNKKILSVWTGHYLFTNIETCLNYIDILVLPTHVVNPAFRKKLAKTKLQLVTPIGVVHNVNEASSQQALFDWQNHADHPIKAAHYYIGVILGGDVTSSDDELLCFTPKEAEILGRGLVNFYNKKADALLLITNSYRTGRYDPVTQQERKMKLGMIDATSAALLQELDRHRVDYQFFDFKSEIVSGRTAYMPILATLKHAQHSIALVTGDSISMISELHDLLHDKPLYIVNVGSMDDACRSYVSSINQAGDAYIVTLNEPEQEMQITSPMSTLSAQQRETAAKQVADVIVERLGLR